MCFWKYHRKHIFYLLLAFSHIFSVIKRIYNIIHSSKHKQNLEKNHQIQTLRAIAIGAKVRSQSIAIDSSRDRDCAKCRSVWCRRTAWCRWCRDLFFLSPSLSSFFSQFDWIWWFFFLGFVCVFVLRNEWYYIFVWQPRKCEKMWLDLTGFDDFFSWVLFVFLYWGMNAIIYLFGNRENVSNK